MRESASYPDSLLQISDSVLEFPKDPEDWTEGCYYEMYLDIKFKVRFLRKNVNLVKLSFDLPFRTRAEEKYKILRN